MQLLEKAEFSVMLHTLGGRLTKCQDQRDRALQNRAPGRFIPRCKEDGSFEEIQCQGSFCYCVDKDGNEIYGTKTYRPDTPNCLVPIPEEVGRILYFCVKSGFAT